MFRKLGPQTAWSGRLSHASFTSDKDPLKGVLLDNIFQGWVGKILVVVELRVGHGCRLRYCFGVLYLQNIFTSASLKVSKKAQECALCKFI